jgi:TPP-dependent pyruvate/acetoin dehydrogenase alpha subunit
MVGISAAITDNDSVITSYRDHCTHLAKGGTMLEVMAELMGRVDGASKGKGGSMHMYRKVIRLMALPLCYLYRTRHQQFTRSSITLGAASPPGI